MPRLVESDEEECLPKRKKVSTAKKRRATSKKAAVLPKKTIPLTKEHDSAITAWAKRRTVETLDGIEDVEIDFLKKERQKQLFEVDYDKKTHLDDVTNRL